MQIKINNDADEFAILQLSGLNSARSLTSLLSTFAKQVPSDEDLEVIISKSKLHDCYKSNPSILGINICNRLPDFLDSSGYQTPQAPNHITIVLHRERKATHQRRSHPKPSFLRVIKEWLDLNLSKDKILSIPTEQIPGFLFTHPEQVTYKIKRETNTPIHILRLKTIWKISRR